MIKISGKNSIKLKLQQTKTSYRLYHACFRKYSKEATKSGSACGIEAVYAPLGAW